MSQLSPESHGFTPAPPVHVAQGRTTGLPRDVVQDGARRLGLAGLVYAIIYLVVDISGLATGTFQAFNPDHFFESQLLTAVAIVLSLGLFALTRTTMVSCFNLCRLGLFYEVGAAAAIDFYLVFIPLGQDFRMYGISWVGVWIISFAMIVPTPPRETLIAALLTASTTPLLLLIGYWRGSSELQFAAAIQFSLPNYMCAVLAFIGSKIVYRLGTQVGEARRLGSYELGERLGEGGMGEVWQARHMSLARPAAIKLIRPRTLDLGSASQADTLFRRFEREARTTAMLRSPHTITLYDFGMTDEGSFYYVMEYLEGMDLDQLVIQFGPLSSERAVYQLMQVCHSLSEAHEKGLIHRDIKPANIYACRLGLDHDFMKVLDFGLVKQSDESAESLKLTMAGAATGTPTYMAPEMAMGGKVDARTDVYSLGCVGFWLLTGHHVFNGESALEVAMHHLQTQPDPPSTRTEIEIPESLDRLILDCLEKDPARRPQNMVELSRRLSTCRLEGRWTAADARRWWTLHMPSE